MDVLRDYVERALETMSWDASFLLERILWWGLAVLTALGMAVAALKALKWLSFRRFVYDDYRFTVREARKGREEVFRRKVHRRLKRVLGKEVRVIADARFPASYGAAEHIDFIAITGKMICPITIMDTPAKTSRITVRVLPNHLRWNAKVTGEKGKRLEVESPIPKALKRWEDLKDFLKERRGEIHVEDGCLPGIGKSIIVSPDWVRLVGRERLPENIALCGLKGLRKAVKGQKDPLGQAVASEVFDALYEFYEF